MQFHRALRLWSVLLAVVFLGPAMAQETTPASVPMDDTAGERQDFTQFFCRGLKSLEIEASWAQQHHIPTDARSSLEGVGLHLTGLRFHSRRSATGLELEFSSLSGEPRSTTMWTGSWLYRRYYSLEPRRAMYWQGGGGAAYLTTLIPEQSSNWNFYMEAATGAQWPTGNNGAWKAEYRFFHVSNAGTSRRNQGINASQLLVGRSIYF